MTYISTFLMIGNIFVVLTLLVITGCDSWPRREYIILRLATIIELRLGVVVSIEKARYWVGGVLRRRKSKK